MSRFVGFVFLLSVTNVASEIFRPKSYGFEDTFYSLLNAKDKTEFREIYIDYMRSIRNENVDPCENFYEYACGNWARVISPHNTTYYSSFESMGHGVNYVLFKLLTEEISAEDDAGTVITKKFFEMCLNSDTWDLRELMDFVESLGPWPLTSNSWSSHNFEWLNATAHAHAYVVPVLFKQTFRNVGSAWTGNFLSVLEEDAVQIFCRSHRIEDRESFIFQIIGKFEELGIQLQGKEDMLSEVYDFEQKLGEFTRGTNEENQLHEHRINDLGAYTRNYTFLDYFSVIQGRHASRDEAVRVIKLEVLEQILSFVNKTDHHIIANTIYLNFILKFLQTLRKIHKDKASQCVLLTKEKLLEPVLSMFVKRYFDRETTEEMADMLNRLMDAGRDTIRNNAWLTHATKTGALAKLDAIQKRVGFKGDLIDADTEINIHEGGFISNLLKVYRYRVIQDQKSSIGFDWIDTPFTVNAHFMPRLSLLSIPLGIMQPPFFHKFNPRFVNYGGLGATVGHEIMHAFDMNGVGYDTNEWFDPRLKRKLHIKMGCYLSQYKKHSLLPVLNATIDGETTLDENVADNEGFQIALKAYKNWLESHTNASDIDKGLPEGNQPSLDNLQAFFLSFAQGWCASSSENGMRRLLNSPHAPDNVRANQVLANSPDFSSAYNCPIGSRMNPVKKCRYLSN